MTPSKETNWIKATLVVPIITSSLSVLVFGEIFGEKLAVYFGIDPKMAIRDQPDSGIYMAFLMVGFVVLILAGWAIGYFLATALKKTKQT